MNPKELLAILETAAKLKIQTRHNWTEGERKESVADHSWRIALLAMLLDGIPEFRDVDLNRVIRMCLIHDLGEAFTGDIPTFEKTEADGEREDDIFQRWIDGFPSPQREEWQALFKEMQAQQTPEARIYKSLDKLEAVIAHDEAGTSHWLPLEYELQYSYAVEQTRFSPFLTELREEMDRLTDRVIAQKDGQEN
ncbi:MAG: HD domain-containing protein [Lachnospiraceae bacterium]|nr:HD domain-containing protein [Lachnospiraceae bacterium]